ncbi:MAG TPA: PqqD family protein [Bacteroidales bacterium]|nr:PqqD family protein [Bacteroidales bacterium]
MGLNFFQRRKILKNANSLELHPVRLHEHDFTEEGNIYLKVPKFQKRWMRDFFISGRKKKHFTIYLDELGTATWLEIDGKKSVQEICDNLKEQLGDKIKPHHEVEERVSKFLSQLYEQRYITFRELQEESQT